MSPCPVFGPRGTLIRRSLETVTLGGGSLCCVIVALLLTLATGQANAALETPRNILFPASGSRVHPGEVVTVRWTPLSPRIHELELLLILDGAGNRLVRLTTQLDPSCRSYRWRVPSLPTTSARIQIRFNRGRGEELGPTSASFQILSSGATSLASLALRDGEWWVVTLAGSAAGPVPRPSQKLGTGGDAAWPLEPLASQGEQDHWGSTPFESAPYAGSRPNRPERLDGERSVGHAPVSMPQRE